MVFSVLLHGALVAVLVFTAVMSTTRAPAYLQSAPVNATVIDSQILHAAQRATAERAAEQARAAAQAQAAAAQAAADAKAADQAKAAEQLKAAADAKAAEEAHAASVAKSDADAKAAEEARADAARAAAEAKRQAEAKRAAEEKQAAEAKAAAEAKQVAEAKRAADARARKEREDELRRQMADEEHTAAVEASPLKDRYVALLRDRIQNAWIKPPSARAGVDCVVQVTQVPGGEVTSAQVTQCNGDAAVRQSIENAVYRASPLPDPPDPALFQRNFAFEFKPNE
jgi:colicin import membrane protein